MLVLSRKRQQQIRIGDDITITILRVQGSKVRIGIEAPRHVRVLRGELPPKQAARAEAVSSGLAGRNERPGPADETSADVTVTEDGQTGGSPRLLQLVRKVRQCPVAVDSAV